MDKNMTLDLAKFFTDWSKHELKTLSFWTIVCLVQFQVFLFQFHNVAYDIGAHPNFPGKLSLAILPQSELSAWIWDQCIGIEYFSLPMQPGDPYTDFQNSCVAPNPNDPVSKTT